MAGVAAKGGEAAAKAGRGSGGNMDELNEFDGTRVAPSPGPWEGLLSDGRLALGLSALEILGDEGNDCVCGCIEGIVNGLGRGAC